VYKYCCKHAYKLTKVLLDSIGRKGPEHLLHQTLETPELPEIPASPTVYNTGTHDALKSHNLPSPQRTESSHLKSSSETSSVSDSNLSAVSNPVILTRKPLAISNSESTARALSTAEEAERPVLHPDLLANPLSTSESLATPQLVPNGTGSGLESRTVASSPDKKLVTSITQDKRARTAWRYQLQGKYTEAVAMCRQTLQLQEKVLGKDHPDTLYTMNSLARLLYKQGKYIEAEAIDRQTLQLREKVLGKDHPDTLWSMYNLADSLYKQGKDIEAEAMYRETLQLQEKVLGKDHPDTIQSMNSLAHLLRQQGFQLRLDKADRRK
jgi:tetratricopeptide (TPR) repeat protein